MATLKRVIGPRTWDGRYGPMASIMLDFGEHQAELVTKPDSLAKRLEMCEQWVGRPSEEWVFADAGTFSDGKPRPPKVTSYPGKQAAPGGSGGARAPRWGDTPEGQAYIQERTDRRTALMQAVAVEPDPAQTLGIADTFYSWLRATVPAPTSLPIPPQSVPDAGAGSSPPAPAPSSAAEANTGPRMGQYPARRPKASGGAEGFGEGPDAPPEHSEHEHAWKQSPTMATWAVCSICGLARPKAQVGL